LNREPAVWVFLSGGQPVERIAEAAEKEVKPRLAGLSSVSSVQFGRLPPGESLREPSLHLVIDREKCRTLEIPVTDVLELLNKALKNQKVTSAKDIGNPIISFHDGKPVRIKDVAEVKDTITVRCRTRIDGKPVIAIGLHAATDTKPADIVQAVKDAFPQIRPHLPEGIGFAVISGR
jgi:multidrug efflux pump subunit AcrB